MDVVSALTLMVSFGMLVAFIMSDKNHKVKLHSMGSIAIKEQRLKERNILLQRLCDLHRAGTNRIRKFTGCLSLCTCIVLFKYKDWDIPAR